MTSTETKTVDLDAATEAVQKPARTRKAPAKKAAATVAVAPAPEKAAAPAKLRWTIVAEHANGKEQTATAEDRAYRIDRDGEAWKASVEIAGKVEVLVEGASFGRAYNAVTRHNKSQA